MIDREPHNELIVIASFENAAELERVRSLLEAAGIDAQVEGGNDAGSETGRSCLLVRESAADAACEVVDRALGVPEPDEEDDGQPDLVDHTPPKSSRRRPLAMVIVALALIAALIAWWW